MDIQPQSTQPISDDQELAKVLAGVNADANEAEATPAVAEMQPPVAPMEPPVAAPAPDPIMPAAPTPMSSPVAIPVAGELDGVKQAAITELRPLVDKLTLPPEEKFDTYLLLIRSTDDKSLIGPAHEAAKMISDETRRAQALLDVIKEIDFLSGSQAA
jgi:hypothetical protein